MSQICTDEISNKIDALESILGNPTVTITRDGIDIYYYSSTQIKEAYEIGATPIKINRKKTAAYNKIREMDVGDTLYFPYDKYGAVRAAASKLKKEFCVRYITKKMSNSGNEAIKIVRLD